MNRSKLVRDTHKVINARVGLFLRELAVDQDIFRACKAKTQDEQDVVTETVADVVCMFDGLILNRLKTDTKKKGKKKMTAIVPVKPPALKIPKGLTPIPDNEQWEHRFLIKSQTRGIKYVIAQNKRKRHWGCSCPSYRVRRYCKHLTSLGLPVLEKPFEPKRLG